MNNLEEGDVKKRGMSPRDVRVSSFLQSNISTYLSLILLITSSMPARWGRLGAYTSATLIVAYMLLQIWRLDTDYPNVTLDKLPAAANNLFTCLEWPRTIDQWTHNTPYCCSYGDCHEATSWVNVRLPGQWRPKTERWSYCEDGPTMCCCHHHSGVSCTFLSI